MLYKPDWERVQTKFTEYWNRENHDRPLINITAPREGYVKRGVKAPEKLEDRWMDMDYIIKRNREDFEATFFGAEAFPMAWPNLGPDIFGAILGDDIEFGTDTSWSLHLLEDLNKVDKFEFNPENKWWKKIKQMTEELVKDSKGDYFVGITDLHPGADGLMSLRGPENLSCDLFDCPDKVKKSIFELFDVFKAVFDGLYSITSKCHKGTAEWMSVWNPGKAYVTSTDFIGIISPDTFKEFILEELLMELDWLDASIFHLDGPGALRHLDALLEIPKLKGIQWVYGAGQPTAAHWIPVLQKIQNAGKNIHVTVSPDDIDPLLENLKPEGLLMHISPIPNDMTGAKIFTEQEARDLIKKVESHYKRKLY